MAFGINNVPYLYRKWNWFGHTLRREEGAIEKTALDWNPQGYRRRGRPKRTWRRTIEDEIRNTGRSWNEVKGIAGDCNAWKLFVVALCSTRSKRTWWWWYLYRLSCRWEGTYKNSWEVEYAGGTLKGVLFGSSVTFWHLVHSVRSPWHWYPTPERNTNWPLHTSQRSRAPNVMMSDKRSRIWKSQK